MLACLYKSESGRERERRSGAVRQLHGRWDLDEVSCPGRARMSRGFLVVAASWRSPALLVHLFGSALYGVKYMFHDSICFFSVPVVPRHFLHESFRDPLLVEWILFVLTLQYAGWLRDPPLLSDIPSSKVMSWVYWHSAAYWSRWATWIYPGYMAQSGSLFPFATSRTIGCKNSQKQNDK